MQAVYESIRISLTDKVFVGVLSENVMFSAASASAFIPRVIIAPDTDCIPSVTDSAYTVSEFSSDWQCNVAANNSTLCSSVTFSLKFELGVPGFISVCGGQGEFFIADRNKLYQVNFTVPGAIDLPRCKRKNLTLRPVRERKVFLNQTIYLSKGVLRL